MKTFLKILAVAAVLAGVAALLYRLLRPCEEASYIPLETE